MTPLRLIRLVMSRAHGLGISTTCYPSPAPVHRSLSSDNERLKLCPRVQTPAPVLGRLHATVPGILAVLVVRRTGREIALQPPASDQPSQCGSRRTLPDLVVGVSPLHNPAARSVLETAPCRWRSSPTPIPQVRGIGSRVTSQPLHCLGHNALFCCHIPTQGSILLSCLALMTARLVGTTWQHLVI